MSWGMKEALDKVFKHFRRSRPKEYKVKDDCCRFANILIQCAVEEGVDIYGSLGRGV